MIFWLNKIPKSILWQMENQIFYEKTISAELEILYKFSDFLWPFIDWKFWLQHCSFLSILCGEGFHFAIFLKSSNWKNIKIHNKKIICFTCMYDCVLSALFFYINSKQIGFCSGFWNSFNFYFVGFRSKLDDYQIFKFGN